jgi:hypothetical protein
LLLSIHVLPLSIPRIISQIGHIPVPWITQIIKPTPFVIAASSPLLPLPALHITTMLLANQPLVVALAAYRSMQATTTAVRQLSSALMIRDEQLAR